MTLDSIDISNKVIIVAPLSWGLGHASRCIPIIHYLLKRGNTVTCASDGLALQLLQEEFPTLHHHSIASYDIRYESKSMVCNILTQSRKLTAAILAEKKQAEKLAVQTGADIIISDNRLGFRSANTKNIYITHQLQIDAGHAAGSALGSALHKRFYSQFDEIWVPDYADERSLAGKLSKGGDKYNTKYIGPLSRMKPTPMIDKKYDTIAVLSGPEPQRSVLEQLLITYLHDQPRVCIVRGTIGDRQATYPSHMDVYDMVTGRELTDLISKSKHILCRSGYSSIMDLIKMERSATLIPTPGQTEQEYLAQYLNGKHGFTTISQDQLLLKIGNL